MKGRFFRHTIIFFFFALWMGSISQIQGQIISTIAGNGRLGTVVSPGIALSEPLDDVTKLQLAGSGALYLNVNGTRIMRMDTATGRIQTVAGTGNRGFSGDGGLAVDATFSNIVDFVVTGRGDILICDNVDNRIRKIDAVTQIITTVAGDGSTVFQDGALATMTGLANLSAIAVDNSGNIFVGASDITNFGSNNFIYKIDVLTNRIKPIAGNNSGVFSGDGTNALQTGFYLSGMRLDQFGNVIFADPVHNCILELNISRGDIVLLAGSGNANIYGYAGDGGLAKNALLNTPVDISFDFTNNILVVDEGNSIIRKIDMRTGFISKIAGNGNPSYSGDGGYANCAGLHTTNGIIYPSGIVGDNQGNFFFVDQSNQRIREVNTAAVQPKTPILSISTTSMTICPGQPVTINSALRNVNQAQPKNYQWFVNGRKIDSADSPMLNLSSLINGDLVTCIAVVSDATCDVIQTESNTLAFYTPNQKNASVSLSATDTSFCFGKKDFFTVNVIDAGDTTDYQWYVNNEKVGGNEGRYSNDKLKNGDSVSCLVSTTMAGCSERQNVIAKPVRLNVTSPPQFTLSPNDTTISAGQPVLIHVNTLQTISTFSWSPTLNLSDPSAFNPTASPTVSTTYSLTAGDSGCVTTQKITIHIGFPFNIPYAFTPNGDGKNDSFRIPPTGEFTLVHLILFDRWGNKVFQTENQSDGWDGRINGLTQPEGNYVYTIIGYLKGAEVKLHGIVVLIR